MLNPMQHRRQRQHTPNRLWKFRKRMGFTQHEVAAILGYHTSTDISHYEHGRKLPSLVTALKLEIVYRVPVAFLFPEVYHALKQQLRAREERLLVRRTDHRTKTPA